MDGFSNTFRVRDENIRPGGSPTDALMSVQEMNLVIGDNELVTPYKEGSEVAYTVFKKGTIEADGKLTIAATEASNAIIFVLGRDMNMTIGGKAF